MKMWRSISNKFAKKRQYLGAMIFLSEEFVENCEKVLQNLAKFLKVKR